MITKIRTIEWKFREEEREYKNYKRMPEVNHPQIAFEIICGIVPNNLIQEQFGVLWLNAINKVIGYEIVSRGTSNMTIVDVRDVFRSAIAGGAHKIILFHNHPSDNTKPSQDDMLITKKMWDAGRLLEIPVYDHIIFGSTKKRYTSFLERKLINSKFCKELITGSIKG